MPPDEPITSQLSSHKAETSDVGSSGITVRPISIQTSAVPSVTVTRSLPPTEKNSAILRLRNSRALSASRPNRSSVSRLVANMQMITDPTSSEAGRPFVSSAEISAIRQRLGMSGKDRTTRTTWDGLTDSVILRQSKAIPVSELEQTLVLQDPNAYWEIVPERVKKVTKYPKEYFVRQFDHTRTTLDNVSTGAEEAMIMLLETNDIPLMSSDGMFPLSQFTKRRRNELSAIFHDVDLKLKTSRLPMGRRLWSEFRSRFIETFSEQVWDTLGDAEKDEHEEGSIHCLRESARYMTLYMNTTKPQSTVRNRSSTADQRQSKRASGIMTQRPKSIIIPQQPTTEVASSSRAMISSQGVQTANMNTASGPTAPAPASTVMPPIAFGTPTTTPSIKPQGKPDWRIRNEEYYRKAAPYDYREGGENEFDMDPENGIDREVTYEWFSRPEHDRDTSRGRHPIRFAELVERSKIAEKARRDALEGGASKGV
jgi:hypothetical protein